jgi:hypothetical protein
VKWVKLVVSPTMTVGLAMLSYLLMDSTEGRYY